MDAISRKKKIRNEDISPHVLTCLHLFKGMDMPAGQKFSRRTVYDYELEFFTESKGAMEIDDEIYEIKKGDIVFKRPGVISQGVLPYNCYLICFDMLGNTGKSLDSYNLFENQKLQEDYSSPLLDVIPTLIHSASYEKYHFLFSSVVSEFFSSAPNSNVLIRSYVLQILYQLYLDSVELKRNEVLPSSAYNTKIKNVCAHIKHNLKTKLDLDTLSKVSGLSPFYFQRIFKQIMGVTPNTYILKLKLEKAKELLMNTRMSITEISLECGFQNIPYFSHVFKQHLGMPPVEYRKKHQYI
jgi:AraC family transcriptional regulator